MKTLSEITDAVRRNEAVTEEELRVAVVTYDVLMARIDVTRYPEAMAEFFKATNGDPREYYGHENAPDNPEYAEWHKAFVNVTGDQDELAAHEAGRAEGQQALNELHGGES